MTVDVRDVAAAHVGLLLAEVAEPGEGQHRYLLDTNDKVFRDDLGTHLNAAFAPEGGGRLDAAVGVAEGSEGRDFERDLIWLCAANRASACSALRSKLVLLVQEVAAAKRQDPRGDWHELPAAGRVAAGHGCEPRGGGRRAAAAQGGFVTVATNIFHQLNGVSVDFGPRRIERLAISDRPATMRMPTFPTPPPSRHLRAVRGSFCSSTEPDRTTHKYLEVP